MGLDSTGFLPESLEDIRDRISDNLKIALGNDIDTSSSSRIGQMIDIFSDEMSSAWLGLQDVYNSFFPDTASGASLDNVVAITNTVRQKATSSQGSVYFLGDSLTAIPAGTEVQKTGTDQKFTVNLASQIDDNANIVIVEALPDAGDITLSWDAEAISAINWNDNAATIKATIEGHSKITDVTVVGQLNVNRAFHIVFNTDTLIDRTPTIDASTLTRVSASVSSEANFSNAAEIDILAENPGEVTVPQISITTIATPVLGVSQVINFSAGITGNNRETDAELRDRRAEELQKSGSTTIGGMRQAIEAVALVDSVTLIENDTSAVDGDGRDPHSIEAFVAGGDDDDVAQAIYDNKPIGIGIVTTAPAPSQRTGNITDVNGVATTLTFSEPTDVPMEIEVSGTKDADYPTDGDQQIKDALIAYFETFELGQDVLNHLLYSPVNEIPGIVTLSILQDTVAGGTPAASNTTIAITELASLIDANITVTMV